MRRILVTGGGGQLGGRIVEELLRGSQAVRVLSRRPAPARAEWPVRPEWARADLRTGQGLAAALEGTAVVVHCASSPRVGTYETDVAGTRLLLDGARAAGVERIFLVSIIGVDRIARPYYQYKLAAELAVVESGIPYTIARCAQFHGFLDSLLSPLRESSAETAVIPADMLFQPIDTADAAAHLAPRIIAGDAPGRLPDFGGPQVLRLGDMAAAWLRAQGIRRALRPEGGSGGDLPVLSSFGDGFRRGYNTSPGNRVGGLTWEGYLRRRYLSFP